MVVTNSGCTGTSTTRTITVRPAPAFTTTAAGATTFCSGGSVLLLGSSGTGYTYQWYNGATAIAGATDSTYTATTTGNYSLTVANSYGCRLAGATISVRVNTAPVAALLTGADSLCLGDTITLRASTTGGAWAATSGVIAITSTGRVTGRTTGTDTAVYTLANACGSATSRHTLRVTKCATGITEIAAAGNDITAYPNPTSGQLVIAAGNPIHSLVITDLLGHVLISTQPNATTTEADLAPLPAGIYLVRINGIYTVRVVKE
ncbi:MAG: T9SS C-terminal target domain-containing protein [Chitinophagia bacterium]|nr:T9SS C-terminal target domain-containing protein [Chitinophagia bacterium]